MAVRLPLQCLICELYAHRSCHGYGNGICHDCHEGPMHCPATFRRSYIFGKQNFRRFGKEQLLHKRTVPWESSGMLLPMIENYYPLLYACWDENSSRSTLIYHKCQHWPWKVKTIFLDKLELAWGFFSAEYIDEIQLRTSSLSGFHVKKLAIKSTNQTN